MNDRTRRYRDAALALALALALMLAPVFALPALSAAQPLTASETGPRPTVAQASPATGAERGPVSAPPTPPHAQSAAPPMRRIATLALVLPLRSSTYGRAADAVKDGFATAAALAATGFEVIAHGDGEALAAIDAARESGARVIVGPLVRDDVKALAGLADDGPWIIALNHLDESSPLPARVYTLALGIDGEARQLVQRARADGAQSVAIIRDESTLQKRFADAFVAEWLLAGGGAPTTMRFDRATEMLALMRRELAKAAFDAVLLALDPQDAALAKPYLGPTAAYTSSLANGRLAPGALLDLDNVLFVDIPWLADPGAATFNGIARREYPHAAFDRLYALGIDAFRVAQAFAGGTAPAKLEFDGATGHLTLESSRQFLRAGTLLQFRGGEIVPAGSR